MALRRFLPSKKKGDQSVNKRPGQPTKYRKDFHNEDFIRLSKQGKNITQIALDWDVDRNTIYEWGKVYKEFSNTLKKGRNYAEAWYMNLGQLAMIGQATVNGQKVKVDVGLYVWLTKNMFKWTDKVAVNKDDEEKSYNSCQDLTNEELDAL